MKVPDEWAMRAAVVPVPWAHPDRADCYETLLDAVLAVGADGKASSCWIILEDGRMLAPKQVSELRELVDSGSIVGVSSF